VPRPLVLTTGFGPFEDVPENPSERIALGLAASPPPGIEVVAEVAPVSFARAPQALAGALERLAPRSPDLLLGLGVHRRAGYRVELRARAGLTKRGRTDVDGIAAAEADTSSGADLRTEVEDAVRAFVAGDESFYLSEDAGGYVCERLYRAHLEHGLQLRRPALFVHVPHLVHARLEAQVADLGRLVAALLA